MSDHFLRLENFIPFPYLPFIIYKTLLNKFMLRTKHFIVECPQMRKNSSYYFAGKYYVEYTYVHLPKYSCTPLTNKQYFSTRLLSIIMKKSSIIGDFRCLHRNPKQPGRKGLLMGSGFTTRLRTS
jgi:hypothetical protein